MPAPALHRDAVRSGFRYGTNAMEFSELLRPLRQLRQLDEALVSQVVELLVVVLAASLFYFVAHRGIVVAVRRIVARSRTHWDDALVEASVFQRLAHIAPALVVFYGVRLIPDLHPMLFVLIQRVTISVLVLVVARSAGAFLSAVNQVYSADPENRDRPIKGYLQIARLVLYLVAVLLILATLLDRSPWIFLSGIGAIAAVMLLIFRDTILGLVASIQLTGNDMVHVGDWIEMPQYGADGDVVDVALHTVKVQNWDKTITTIPTHKLIEDAFKNWRGMSEAGARRIKRSIFIDLNTIRFLDEDEIDRIGRFALMRDYMERKRDELESYNAQGGLDPSHDTDIRRLTNIGTFRAYVVSYLRAHPKIHQGQTLIVRQRDSGPFGLPLEIYAFTSDTNWSHYEDIQSDIFDHILAVLPEFSLRAFQNPSGADFARLGER